MRLLTILFLALLLQFNTLFAQENYKRVKINCNSGDLQELAYSGLTMEGHYDAKNKVFICEISEKEFEMIVSKGFDYEVLVDDLKSFYKNQNEGIDLDNVLKGKNGTNYVTPENFQLGTLAGFLTVDEMLEELDSMHSKYPNLISEREIIGFMPTHENRDIYFIKISDNPELDEEEAEIFYNAMHHAREPASMQQLIFYMWYLLENYETNEEIKYLVDNLEMFFVPCVNPDGYIYNETQDPNGGGMWRKNRRDNGAGSYGVDLNRNYGQMWGYDNFGSSPYPDDDTYRGPSAFSEPESQNIKYFCENRNFSLALNNHTFGNYLIYPWGYDNILTDDSTLFVEYARLLTKQNAFTYGTCFQTLNYNANGGTDDWMYVATDEKDRIISFTPESGLGEDGFWPSINRIEEICAGNMFMNLSLANLALNYANVVNTDMELIGNKDSYFHFNLKNIGLKTPAVYTISIQPLDENMVAVGEAFTTPEMVSLETYIDSISYSLRPDIQNGDEFGFEILMDNGSFVFRDTIYKTFGATQIVYSNNCEIIEDWTTNSWDITDESYFSPEYSITDSPNDDYSSNTNSYITLTNPINFSNVPNSFLTFKARWDIEDGYDYAVLYASTDGGSTWTAMEGAYTNVGSSNQLEGEPLYDGTQSEWITESINLQSLASESSVIFKFVFHSDSNVEGDGFYFDDFQIYGIVTNFVPYISEQQAISTEKNVPVEILLNQITVIDQDNTYPDDFTLTVLQGENYSVENNIITPAAEFMGELSVPIFVSDGIQNSNIYNLNVEVTFVAGIENELLNAKIYPIPAKDYLNFELSEDTESFEYLEIMDLTGRIVYRQNLEGSNKVSINVSSLNSGLYIISLKGTKLANFTFIKE